MMFKKGDTIELGGSTLGLVLDNGIDGVVFWAEHAQQRFCEVFYGPMYYTTFYVDPRGLKGVWYPVLVGDKKVWYCISAVDRWYNEHPFIGSW